MLEYLKQLEESMTREQNMAQLNNTMLVNQSQHNGSFPSEIEMSIHQNQYRSSMDRVEEFNSPHQQFCQQCQVYINDLNCQHMFIQRLVSSLVAQTRRITSTCLEGSMLLRITSKENKKEQSDTSSASNSNQKHHKSSLEKKMAIIRHANKFLQRDLTKFMDPGYPKNERLFKYVSDISEIASELI